MVSIQLSDDLNGIYLPEGYENEDAAHVLLDARAAHSGLEGAFFSHMLSFVGSLFESDSSDFSRILAAQLTQCAKWAKSLEEEKLEFVTQDIACQAQSLAINDSILIPGGWKGEPFGHAMLYLLTKTGTETYTLRVINTGKGLNHHVQIEGRKKTKALLASSFVGIPREALFYGDKDRDFFKTLLSLKITTQKSDFDPKVIYQGALVGLNAYRNDTDLIEHDWMFITPQRSGTCTFKASKAYIRLAYLLAQKSKEEYKAFSRNLKEETLRAYFKHAEKDPSDQNLNLLRAMEQKVAHTFRKTGEVIPKRCSNLLRTIDDFLSRNPQHRPSKSPSNAISYRSNTPSSPYKMEELQLSIPQITNALDYTSAQINGNNAHTRATEMIARYSDTQVDPYLIHDIDVFASQLSLSRKDWNNGTAFNEVQKLLEIYDSYSRKHSEVTSRHLITVLTLYYALWAMFPYTIDSALNKAAFINSAEAKKLLATLIPPKDLFEEIDKNPFFLLLKSKEQTRFLKLRQAFKQWETEEKGCSIFQGFFSEKDQDGDAIKVIPNPIDPEISFYEKYNALLTPEFKKTIKVKCRKVLEAEIAKEEEKPDINIDSFFDNPDIRREYQDQSYLASFHEPWQDSFPPFLKLLKTHHLMGKWSYRFLCSSDKEAPMGALYHKKGTIEVMRPDHYKIDDEKASIDFDFSQKIQGYSSVQTKAYLLHRIDVFARKLSLNREDWKNGTSFNQIYEILKLYQANSIGYKGDGAPHHCITILTLYYVLWATFPHTIDQSLNEKAFIDAAKAKKLIATLIPPNDLFAKIESHPFFLLLNPQEQTRFLEIRKAFEQWETEEKGCSIFQGFFSTKDTWKHANKVIPNPLDPEISFYQKYHALLNSKFKEENIDDGLITPDVSKVYQEQGILATQNAIWEKSFPPFAQLRNAHYFIGQWSDNFSCDYENNILVFTYDKVIVPRPPKEESTQDNPFFFQKTYGYRTALPSLLEDAFQLKSLATKKDVGSFTQATQKETNPLEKTLDIKQTTLDTQAFLKECASLTTQRSLAPFELLTLYVQHASLLQNSNHRALFLTQLFKTSREGKNAVQEAIGRAPIAIGEKATLLANTLETLALHGGSTPDHHLFLFASYILSSLSQYYPSSDLPAPLKTALQNQRDLIQREITHLSQKEDKENQALKRLYHLHYLHALTIDPQKTGQDLTEIFSHYFAFSSISAPKDNPFLFIEYAVISRIHDLLPILMKKDRKFFSSFIQKIITKNRLNLMIKGGFEPDHLNIDLQSTSITFRDEKGISVELHIATGDIFYGDTRIARSGDFDKESESYRLLFGNSSYPVLTRGDIKYLTHPAGTFRKIGNQISFKFQNQGPWVIFHPADQMSKTLPLPLRKGYRHFYNPDKQEWTFVKGQNYKAFATSLTWKAGAQKIYSHRQTFYYAPAECQELTKIERPDSIYKKVYQGHQTHIEMPRYNLVFIADQGKLKWQQNTAFHLVENNLPPNTLCVQEQSLLLQHTSGKQLLLVPRFLIKDAKGFDKKATLRMPLDVKAPVFDWATPLTQADYNSYHVVRDEIGKVRLIPLKTEDTLMLAYYSLHNRDFQAFHSLIKLMSPFDTLSNTSLSILKSIMSYGSREKNSSPEVAASILRAWMVFYRAEKKQNPSKTIGIPDRILRIAVDYLSTKSHIDKSLRLTREEEKVYGAILPKIFGKHVSDQEIGPDQINHPPSLDLSLSNPKIEFFIYWSDCRKKHQPTVDMGNSTPTFGVYEAIRLKTFDLKTIETQLLMKRDDTSWIDKINVLLLCIEAKRQGKNLPKLPYFSEEDVGAEADAKLAAFRKALQSALKGIVYTASPPPKPTVPPSVLESFNKPRKKTNSIPFYPPTFLSLSKTCQPLWKTAMLSRQNHPLPTLPSLSLPTVSKDVSPFYQPAIETEHQRVSRDIQAGKKRLAERERLIHIGRSYGDPETLTKALEKEIEIAQKRQDAAKNQVLQMVNHHLNLVGSAPLTKEQIRSIEGTLPPLTIKKLEHIALWGEKDVEALKRAYQTSPQLQDKALQQKVWEKLCLYEQEAVTMMAYQKALGSCKRIQQTTGIEQNHHYADLAATLETNLAILAKDSHLSFLQMLIFARLSTLIPREDQVADIIELSKGPCILQKIMGGGKTSVIASLWAFKQARYGTKLPVLFAESSLYSSLGDNLKKGQKSAFGQDIFTINSLHSDLGLYRLQEIEASLKRGLSNNQVLVIKDEMLRMLDLEFQKLTDENNHAPHEEALREMKKEQEFTEKKHRLMSPAHYGPHEKVCFNGVTYKVLSSKAEEFKTLLEEEYTFKNHSKRKREACLRSILSFFKNHVSALGDEIDLLLRSDFEVNLPMGHKIGVTHSRIDLIRRLFEHLAFDHRVGFKKDRQGLLSKKEQRAIFNDLAKMLLNHDKIGLKQAPEDVKRDFCTFLIGENIREIPEKERNGVNEPNASTQGNDRESHGMISFASHAIVNMICLLKQPLERYFGKAHQPSHMTELLPKKKSGRDIPEKLKSYVNKLKSSDQEKDREASELISLAHHIVVDILPFLLKQSPGLHFGRTHDPSYPGKVVPFIGVNTPSHREVGYHYEALCKQFYTATIKGVSRSQLEGLISAFETQAKREVALKKCAFQSTKIARYFKRLTGQNLDRAQEKDVAKAALQTINNDIRRCLAIEAETALRQVGHYQAYRTSSAQALPHLVDSIRGMTGTPWNHDGYHQKIGELKEDIGAEGQILYTLLNRSSGTKVRAVEAPSIKALLDQETSGKGAFPDVILDMGALFKRESIEAVARQFLTYAQEKGIKKNAVLFFHNKAEEKTRDHLAVGRFIGGKWQIEILENTRKQALIDKGLTIDGCLTFFDQRHCTGTDIPLPFRAHAIVTVGQNIELRTLLQTIMRQRLFCSSQTANFAMLQEFYNVLKGEKSSVRVEDLITTAIINQAEKKALSTFRSFKQQIDEVFVDRYRSYSRKGNIPKAIVDAYRPLLGRQVIDSPYMQFFREKVFQDPIETLKDYRKERLALFSKALPPSLQEDLREIERKTAAIVEKAKQKKEKMPTKILTNEDIQGKELETQVEQEQEQEQEEEIAQKIQQELETYQENSSNTKAEHKRWWNPSAPQKSIRDFIQAIRENDLSHPTQLLSAPEIFKQVQYAPGRCFEKLFPNNILMTAAMQRSYDKPLPIFHQSQKIAESLLIVEKEGGYAFVIVSRPEADFLLKHMPKIDGVWLVNGSGHSYLDHVSTTPLLQDPQICQSLVQLNLFAGRATSIEDIPNGRDHLQAWLKGNDGSEKDRRDYLSLKGFYRPALDKAIRLVKELEQGKNILAEVEKSA